MQSPPTDKVLFFVEYGKVAPRWVTLDKIMIYETIHCTLKSCMGGYRFSFNIFNCGQLNRLNYHHYRILNKLMRSMARKAWLRCERNWTRRKFVSRPSLDNLSTIIPEWAQLTKLLGWKATAGVNWQVFSGLISWPKLHVLKPNIRIRRPVFNTTISCMI